MTRISLRYRVSLRGILIVVAIFALTFAYASRKHTVEWEQIDATFVDVDAQHIDDLRKSHGKDYAGAVRVHQVGNGGPADTAGIREGDLLLGVHGRSFYGTDTITDAKPFLSDQLLQGNRLKFYASRRGKLYSGYMHR